MAKRFYSTFYNLRGSRFDVEIWDTEHSGVSSEIQLADPGISIRYGNENGERYSAVIGSEAEISILITNATVEELIDDLASSQEGRFTVYITRGDGFARQWIGRVMPDISIYEDIQYPYLFTLKATDGLAALKNIPYNNDGDPYFGDARLITHLTNAITKLSHIDRHYNSTDIFLITSVDWWEETMTSSKSNDPLYLSWVDHATFYDFKTKGEREYKSCWDVINNICTTFGCRIYHVDGAYFVDQITYRTSTNVESRRYSKTGSYLSNSTISGANDIDQTVNGARLTLVQYDYLPPLRHTRIIHEVNNRVNLIGSAQIDNSNKTLTIYQPVETNGGQTTLRLTGNINLTVTNDDYTGSAQQLLFIFEIKIKVGTKYALRQYQIQFYNWSYSNASWETGSGSRISYILSAWPRPSTGQTLNYTIPINWTSPPLLEGSSAGTSEFAMDLVGVKTFDSSGAEQNLFLGDFTISWDFDNAWLEVLSFGQPSLNDDEVVYFTDSNEAATNTAIAVINTLVGDYYVNPNSIGRLKTGASSTSLTNTQNWGVGNDTRNKAILAILSEYTFKGQNKPIKRMSGTLTGGFDLKKPFKIASTRYLLMGGTFNASRDELTGNWFELHYGAEGVPATPIKRKKYTYTAPDPSHDNVPSGNAGAGGGPQTENIGSPSASILRPVAYATTDGEIAAGAKTTIDIEQTLVFGDFVDGDVVTIVHPIKGFFEDLTISATSQDNDTSLDVTGTLLLDYPASSFILKKPLLSAFKLPGGAADKDLLIWDAGDSRWKSWTLSKYVDDTAAIADGLEAGDIYVVDKGNDAIPEGVLKIVL